ncbi:helix-turn-helix transcriptional regulator [Nocardia sp. NBC_00565]|uniref:helix-turn-helix transcriptional regulator n=1 Tax=Nocardia sp. NBC_00565 TaxID=2975993 RepID=UPI002E80A2C9|nr:helix-turn-helix transcriptional regulator [Nocardia sp. NBC_00565]WUC01643.1 helix-turn-helix transcriptional regulator [Nocardia sp. NBC_00565]
MGLDQVCQVYLPASTALVLKVPRDEIDHRVPLDEPRRVVFDMGCGLGRVVQGIIRDVHAEQSALTDREFNAVCDRVSELLCMMAMGDMSPQRAHLAETTEVIRRYVRENVGVADLRLPAVARALGWSPRQLRLALEQAGTTYRAVRQDEAMRAARGMLEQQGPLAIAISEVAARSGFTVNWFSTAFKVRYGETPRDFRKRRWAESADSSSAVTLPD